MTGPAQIVQRAFAKIRALSDAADADPLVAEGLAQLTEDADAYSQHARALHAAAVREGETMSHCLLCGKEWEASRPAGHPRGCPARDFLDFELSEGRAPDMTRSEPWDEDP